MKTPQLLISFLLVALVLPSTLDAQVPAITITNTFQPAGGAGNWHVPANWQHGVPTRAHTAWIPSGTVCTAFSAPATIDVGAIQVDGTLTVPGGPGNAIDWTMKTDRIDVVGTFSVGSSAPNDYFQGAGEITLTHLSNVGQESKHIEVHPGATFLMYGNPTKTSWTRLTDGTQWQGSLSGNPSNLVVEGNALGWTSSDQLAISTTDFSLTESETAYISSAIATGPNTSITLAAPMTRAHFSRRESAANGQYVDMRAAVGRLNRNLRIVGDTTSALRWGGDIRILQAPNTQTTVHVSYVEFHRMGKYGKLGKYPMHFHECGDMGGTGTGSRGTITGCSFHECYHRAMSIHSTHRVEVRDCTAYEIYGHAYFLEAGDETGNLFKNNLGMNIRTPTNPNNPAPAFLGSKQIWAGASTVGATTPFKFFRYHDQNPAVFWISNYANRFIGNVALGSEAYGFTFDMAVRGFDKDGANFKLHNTKSGAYKQFINPTGGSGFKQFQFDDNTAGGCARTGFFSDEDGEGRARPILESGGVLLAHQSLDFVRCTAFKCRMAGIWYRQYGEAVWSDCRFSDNALGAYFASEGWTEDNQNWEIPYAGGPFHQVFNWPTIGAPCMSHQLLELSLMIGDSTNTGRPGNVDWDATAGRSIAHHRSLQPTYPILPSQPIAHRVSRTATTSTIWSRGVTIYDGLVGIADTHFENFSDQLVVGGTRTRRAAALTVNGVGDFPYVHGSIADPWRVDPRNYTTGISFATTVPLDNQMVFPTPSAPQKHPITDPLLPPMGWIYAGGLNEVVIHDLDGSLTSFGPGYVTNANSPLLWRNAPGATPVFGSTGGHIWSHIPGVTNEVAALQIEMPWDWFAATPPGITSGFRNMRLALPPPQAADFIELYDMDAYLVRTLGDYATKQRATTSQSKRRFGTNVLAGSMAMGTTPPQYDLSYQNVILNPDAVEFAVRLRFGTVGSAVILKMPRPSSFTVKSVWTASPPLVGALGATGGVGGINSFPTTNHIYQPITQHTAAVNRAALDTNPGNGWWQSGNDLYLRLELPPRATAAGADPVYTGAESILVVKFL